MEFNTKEYSDTSLSYLVLQHREQLKNHRKSFKKTLKLTELKLSLTNKLISLNKSQIQHMSSEELRVLNRQQIFFNYLENALEKLHEWRNASPEEKKRIWKKVRDHHLAKQQEKCAKIERDGEDNKSPEKDMQSNKRRKIDVDYN
ncbi:unnamed protein product [Ceratitis capitata]|uniref:(Mediterranean fruit fly) hypothetical protein n=1 Tax=Ceratitis capitata TaxID=7213 RepID=A0A811UQ12_CERCA|nr:unnamed protein product [Ceratitis capitata]